MIDDLISPEYREQNRLLHESELAVGRRWGDTGWTHAEEVLKFAEEIIAFNMIDYGCGHGMLKLEIEKRGYSMEIDEYDPSVPGKDNLPAYPRDLVVCTDVMEHVEEEKVLNVLSNIWDLSKRGVFFNISCKPAKAVLSDGRNAHVTVKPPEWWINKIKKFPWEIARTEIKKSSVKIWITHLQ